MSKQGSVLEKPLKLEDLLQRDIWDVDEDPHIEIPMDDQTGIPKKALVYLCPAGCYTMIGDKVLFSYEGCFECGLCRVVTPKEKIRWEYPKSGKGIQFRFT
ncbi:MAG: 4Fe-4S dicluster domain-containing protein [Desulfurococcales archaeon]|nr:4Fe-4S dicluster domain-containing protein [Desulfurococcales archaeon]